mmetsp:Transcript_22630/g.37388  ORF Transcript_22630/g.37388 Transcript_22630/m.37388 type:complete len:205 (-) Transcript_22630:257-871(-)
MFAVRFVRGGSFQRLARVSTSPLAVVRSSSLRIVVSTHQMHTLTAKPLPLISLLCRSSFVQPSWMTLTVGPLIQAVRSAHSYPVYSGKKKKLKLKTHQGAKKRFRRRADGSFVHGWAGKRHLQVGNSRRRNGLKKRKLKVVTNKGFIKRLRRLLPGSKVRTIPDRKPNPRFCAEIASADAAAGRRALLWTPSMAQRPPRSASSR